MPVLDDQAFEAIAAGFKGSNYRNPSLLSTTQLELSRVLLIGSCLADDFKHVIPCKSDFILFNGGVLPALPAAITDYDFAVCQIPLRKILPEGDLWRIPFYDDDTFNLVSRQAKRRLHDYVAQLQHADSQRQIPFFYFNFLIPVSNPNGHLQKSHTVRNVQTLIAQLNAELETICGDTDNSFAVDVDSIANTYGKRYFTDESIVYGSHGGLFVFFDDGQDGSRIEATPHTVAHFEFQAKSHLLTAVFNEISAKIRVLKNLDPVKMIVVDLDDTLWKGVIGDAQYDAAALTPGSLGHRLVGWEMGVIEALMYCRKRGILLAIVSKNDEALIKLVFPAIFNGILSFDDFAITRINFDEKAANMAAILATTNLLPHNVLFIDDNPVERAKMNAAFPDMRIIGKYFLYTRHLLLNAPELQVRHISLESTQRTAMVQQQALRKSAQAASSPEDFLKSLNLTVKAFEIRDLDTDPKAERLIELINKTNQWNSTGDKVDKHPLKQAMAAGERIYGFSATDKFTPYGDIAFVRVQGNSIVQFCMSCRVAGLNIEHFIIRHISNEVKADPVMLRYVATEKNSAFFSFISLFKEASAGVYAIHTAELGNCDHIANG